jgi:signal peptidase I
MDHHREVPPSSDPAEYWSRVKERFFASRVMAEYWPRLLGFFILRVIVEGPSMLPTYVPGETLTALRRWPWRPVRTGDVVVLLDPRNAKRWMLKRCVGRVGRRLDLRGDNVDVSSDSRDFGLVKARDVKYIVLATHPS